jgi:predicted enzyme related to lactoylglutathione lyase
MGGFGVATDDCRKAYEELSAKGVEFVQPPSERPYGVEAVMRDNSGNWLVLVQQHMYHGEDFPHTK